MRRRVLKLLLFIFLIFSPAMAHAAEIDDLVDVMVQNGLLTQAEAKKILQRTQERLTLEQEVREERFQEKVQSTVDARMDVQTSSFSKLMRNTIITGDLGVRYQYSETKDSTLPNNYPRNQGRLRYRLGIVTRLNEKVTVAAGITSGGQDPRSSYSTFTNASEKFPLELDHAYAQWKAAPWANFIVGQYPKESYLWTPSDMMWDQDIRPQGAAAHFSKKLGQELSVFLNSGINILKEDLAVREDPTLLYFQPGVKFENEHFDFTTSANRYTFHGLRNYSAVGMYSACTNSGLFLSGECQGAWTYNYDDAGASAEMGFRFFLWEKEKRIAFFGDYIRNIIRAKERSGWAGGIKIGDREVLTPGDWQVIYQYTYLEKDAVPDFLPNSERYDGRTNIRGIKLGLDVGLWKDINLGVNFYRDDLININESEGIYKARHTNILADVTYKF